MFYPAYPSAVDLSRKHAAEDRDVVDLIVLRELRGIVADAIAGASRIDRIHHPDRRWSTEDLLDALQGAPSHASSPARTTSSIPGIQ